MVTKTKILLASKTDSGKIAKTTIQRKIRQWYDKPESTYGIYADNLSFSILGEMNIYKTLTFVP